MKFRYARERVARWLHPTIRVPVYAPVADPPEYELDKVPTPERLGALCGYRSGDVMVIVSPSVDSITHLDFCGASSCDTYIPGFPPCVCTLPVGHDGMHHEHGVPCHWMESRG